MSLNASAAHILDDFLESIEELPGELKAQLATLAAKDGQFEDARKALFKKRNLYLRADEKGLDSNIRTALLKKTEKEHTKLLAMIDEKLELETRLHALIEQHLTTLETEMTGKLGMNVENPYSAVFSEIPDVASPIQAIQKTLPGTKGTDFGDASTSLASRPSPKKWQTTPRQDGLEGTLEPVYCYCRQPSYGEMIACDNPSCKLEWFHYPCVGLTSPPKGRWYCKNCAIQSPNLPALGSETVNTNTNSNNIPEH